ncbi:hypothetical protein J1N35_038687 [Gossypium stocksii]|uniref:Uncharacterized protein n=1 Tax=Gossypium stocksii TaxID=47602 RepID=A0A9D3UMK8_9ROSI|nr:hypothetical protein J1N35_038687 [Gossypium stocksii]
MERFKSREEILWLFKFSVLRKNVMDLVTFDGNHNGGSSAAGIEVEGGGREEPFACYFATWVLKKIVHYHLGMKLSSCSLWFY